MDPRVYTDTIVDITLENLFKASAPLPISLLDIIGEDEIYFHGTLGTAECKAMQVVRKLQITTTICLDGAPFRLTYMFPETIIERLRREFLRHIAGRPTLLRALNF